MGEADGALAPRLFLFLTKGAAGTVAGYRPGARHALMIFAAADGFGEAEHKALTCAAEAGWLHLDALRCKEISADPRDVRDDTLRGAMNAALSEGAGLVVYRDEIPPDG